MNNIELEEFVVKTINKLSDTKISKISLETSFEDLNINILDLIEIIMLLEDKLEFTPNIDIYNLKTVGELIKHIKQLIK